MEKIYTYKITNNLNGKYYIGVHKQDSRYIDKYMGGGKLINAAIKKYGVENFTKVILSNFLSEEEAYLYEKELVNQKFIDDPNTYNIRLGGKGGSKKGQFPNRIPWNKGLTLPQSVKDKISKTKKGKKSNRIYLTSDITKQKISHTLKGKKLTSDRKESISKGLKLRWILYRINKIMKKRYEEVYSGI